MYTGNNYEDRLIGKLDRRMGQRFGSSPRTAVPRYNGGTERNVLRRSDAPVAAPQATPVVRPAGPVVRRNVLQNGATKVVAAEPRRPELAPESDRELLKVRFQALRDAFMAACEDVEDVPRPVLFGAKMIDLIDKATTDELTKLRDQVAGFEEQLEERKLIELGRRTMAAAKKERIAAEAKAEEERKRRVDMDIGLAEFRAGNLSFSGLTERFGRPTVSFGGPPAVKPPEDFTWSVDLSRPKLKKPQRKGTGGGQKSSTSSTAATSSVSDREKSLLTRIEALTDLAIRTVCNNKSIVLTMRFGSKEKLLNAAKRKNETGFRHVTAFVEACERQANSN